MPSIFLYNNVSKQISLTSLNDVTMGRRHTNLTKETFFVVYIWFDINLSKHYILLLFEMSIVCLFELSKQYILLLFHLSIVCLFVLTKQ